MLQQLHDAISVEHVAAAKLGARLLSELASADKAQLLVSVLSGASCVDARKTSALISYTLASMTAFLMGFVTESSCWLFGGDDLLIIDHWDLLYRHLKELGITFDDLVRILSEQCRF